MQKAGNVEAVKNVSFEVEKGDIFGIIGYPEQEKVH